jgi:hypothetical protein
MHYSHSYEDPETGQLVDVMVDDGDEYRNATLRERPGAPRDHRSQVTSSGGRRFTPPPRHSSARPPGPLGGGLYGSGPLVGRDYGQHSLPPQRPPVVHAPAQPVGFEHGQYIAIKKSALAEIIPSVGHLWAAFLGMPAAPQAVGEDKVDRDNAALHRDALAKHQQNQTRILALTDLASRAVKLFAS